MSIDEIVAYVESLGGVLTLRPAPGDGSPEIAWGDAFFYFAPDGVVPRTQPFATIVTKDYPDEPSSGLGEDGDFRVNIAADPTTYRTQTGRDRREGIGPEVDLTARDVVLPHPTYSAQGWLAVVNPGLRSESDLHELLASAHRRARAHAERRTDRTEA